MAAGARGIPSAASTPIRLRPEPGALLRLLAVLAAGALLSACATLTPVPRGPSGARPLVDHAAVVEVPAQTPGGDTFVVFYSGDGGWAKIDRGTTAVLAKDGYPVVGVDSLHYFWSAKTPQQASADLERIIDTYAEAWKKPRVILVGFSFGAGTLPKTIEGLSERAASRIRAVVLMAPRRYVEFVLRPNSWLDIPGPTAFPFEPTLVATRRWPVLCVYGENDHNAACPQLPPAEARAQSVPGGHRLNHDYARIAALIEASPNRQSQ
ncbi:MAG TPA: AcvB/VirJ family lysyl-phosphatidylglycerol hydrolase [Caulobacteraceae bacterium]|nr:AcvB/VirJ family lysyl-phosphatidylglycerol hydrolase [Caulobacteraceae bacterium]